MRDERVTLTLDNFEQRLMVNSLNEFMNILRERGKPLEDLEDLILKVIDAPSSQKRHWAREESR